MEDQHEFKIGQIVKNSQTGEAGVIKRVIYGQKGVFSVIVKTRTGKKRWVVKRRKESLWKKLKSLIRF
jgi:hypothetical protein